MRVRRGIVASVTSSGRRPSTTITTCPCGGAWAAGAGASIRPSATADDKENASFTAANLTPPAYGWRDGSSTGAVVSAAPGADEIADGRDDEIGLVELNPVAAS